MRSSEMQLQRDQALACLMLAICVTVAVFLSVFGKREKLAIEDARKAVALHESLFRESAKTLQQNQDALNAVRAALANIDGAHQR